LRLALYLAVHIRYHSNLIFIRYFWRFMVFRPLLVLLALMMPICVIAAEGTESALQEEGAYFAEVNETGGYVTQKLHDDFWQLMHGKYDEAACVEISAKTLETLALLKEFQQGTWESAKLSYFSQTLEKTKDYEDLKKRLSNQGSHYFSNQAIIEHSSKIILAAASRQALDLGNGKFYITPELIEENLIGIQGAFERLKLLMTPDWQNEYKEYILSKINATLLALYAPDQYHEAITHNDESIDIHIAQLNTDKDTTYELGSVDYHKGERRFTDFTPEEKEIYIQEFIKDQFLSYRIESPVLNTGTWRGYQFVKGSASVDDFNVVMMCMMVNQRAFYIKLVTKMHIPLANDDFNEFIKRIQILDQLN
jgi:hypothetical protein